MRLKHLNCDDSDCPTCLDDHLELDKELNRRCHTKNFDHLREYRTFWENKHGVCSETKAGWALREVFDEEDIADYCFEYTGELQ